MGVPGNARRLDAEVGAAPVRISLICQAAIGSNMASRERCRAEPAPGSRMRPAPDVAPLSGLCSRVAMNVARVT